MIPKSIKKSKLSEYQTSAGLFNNPINIGEQKITEISKTEQSTAEAKRYLFGNFK